MYIRVYIYTYMYTYTYIYKYIYIIYIYLYVYIYIYSHIHVHFAIPATIYKRVYIYTYMYTYTYKYIYIYIDIGLLHHVCVYCQYTRRSSLQHLHHINILTKQFHIICVYCQYTRRSSLQHLHHINILTKQFHILWIKPYTLNLRICTTGILVYMCTHDLWILRISSTCMSIIYESPVYIWFPPFQYMYNFYQRRICLNTCIKFVNAWNFYYRHVSLDTYILHKYNCYSSYTYIISTRGMSLYINIFYINIIATLPIHISSLLDACLSINIYSI